MVPPGPLASLCTARTALGDRLFDLGFVDPGRAPANQLHEVLRFNGTESRKHPPHKPALSLGLRRTRELFTPDRDIPDRKATRQTAGEHLGGRFTEVAVVGIPFLEIGWVEARQLLNRGNNNGSVDSGRRLLSGREKRTREVPGGWSYGFRGGRGEVRLEQRSSLCPLAGLTDRVRCPAPVKPRVPRSDRPLIWPSLTRRRSRRGRPDWLLASCSWTAGGQIACPDRKFGVRRLPSTNRRQVGDR